jgi:hypothetical protein
MNRGDFWGPIPVYILQDHRHRAGHLRVLGAILSCPQPHFPSLGEISHRSGHTTSYCSKMISELVKMETLEREQRYNDTNVYRLSSVSTKVVESTNVVGSESTNVVGLKESLKENNNTTGPKIPGYWQFCKTYPRHRLGVRRALHQYWILNDLENDSSRIIRCLEGHVESVEWQSESGKWVPGAKKFLEQERWVDYNDDPMSRYEED